MLHSRVVDEEPLPVGNKRKAAAMSAVLPGVATWGARDAGETPAPLLAAAGCCISSAVHVIHPHHLRCRALVMFVCWCRSLSIC